MNIAITGSTGFLGIELCKKIKILNHNIIHINKRSGYDIADYKTLSNVPEFDLLIHLAAETYIPDSYIDPIKFYNTNVLGTMNMLELCRKYNAKIIYTSSYIYGVPEKLPIDEKHKIQPSNPYSESKYLGENLCKAYYRDFDVSYMILRPFNIYGPNQNKNFLLSKIINSAKDGLVELMDSRPKRDYIYIDDVISAYTAIIQKGFVKNLIINIGSGESYSISEILDIVQKNIKNNFKVVYLNKYRKNEILDTVADISLAKETIGWTPATSIKQGIKKIIEDENFNCM
tara:strand:- start:133 stop:993 length:861 start_codon:yes stop_codon:yes gene_type:complete